MNNNEPKIFFPLGKTSHIAYVENALKNETCREIIELGQEVFDTFFYQGPTMGGVDKKTKNCFDWAFAAVDERYTKEQIEKSTRLDKEVYEGLNTSLMMYVKEYFHLEKNWINIIDTRYQVQKYIKGEGFYKSHIDGGPYTGRETRDRILAAVIYLNTIEEGGGTFFDDHDISIEAVEGRISIFPAYWTHPHGGMIPISGDKWIISTFISIKNG